MLCVCMHIFQAGGYSLYNMAVYMIGFAGTSLMFPYSWWWQGAVDESMHVMSKEFIFLYLKNKAPCEKLLLQ